MLVACGPDNRVALAEKLMAERETDSAITVMNEIKEPLPGIISIICGTIAFVVWQIVGGGGTWMFLMPVVAGCLVSTISFFVVNWIEWGRGVAPAPSAYLTDEEVARKIAEESAGR